MSAREVALSLLGKVEDQGAYSNLLLQRDLPSMLSDQDRRLVVQLFYGYFQYRGALDAILHPLLPKGLLSLPLWIQRILRLALYQILYLDKIPAYAAVNEAVQSTRTHGFPKLAGLVNGVLRSAIRQREREEKSAPPPPTTLPERSSYVSVPAWMLRRLENQYGRNRALDIAVSWLRLPSLHVRVNPLRTTPVKLCELGGGEVVPSEFLPESLHGGGPRAATLIFEWMKKGWCTLQDESSMLVTYALDPRPGEYILDACAAPGGKTGHIAERMGDQGTIVACDCKPHRVLLLKGMQERLGLVSIDVRLQNLLNFEPKGFFDAVLLDAPCSGLGVLRRKPELKWRFTEDQIVSLAILQRKLLCAAARCLRPKGRLVYAVCTWTEEETIHRVDEFQSDFPDFLPDVELLRRFPQNVRDRVVLGSSPHWLQILPKDHWVPDAFFLAAWRKP
ncbi:16S rRNA (cytosine(967)-C(5))-methyltransferase RsmB [Pasteuria penetrans]|uniref:16S rRNA (cytosine(967)-C(5))-methyltransferase RsmB n=1 Tax=Pasteuria penetrans TaxID=86005 RepID=UPI000FA8DE2C|nr:16S rRNA (cytosine(967)-C(5))-methyltransferase RsmB [Pasteuria penetrans]